MGDSIFCANLGNSWVIEIMSHDYAMKSINLSPQIQLELVRFS